MNIIVRITRVSRKSKRRKKTIKQQQKCIDRLKMDVRKAMGMEHKLLPDDAVWNWALDILRKENERSNQTK